MRAGDAVHLAVLPEATAASLASLDRVMNKAARHLGFETVVLDP